MILHKLKTNKFTMVENAFIHDERVSWKAKGIMLYLLSRPESWEVHVSDIMNHGTEGEFAVRAAMKELRRYGYAKLENIRENGRIVARRITISEGGELVDAFLNRENLNKENQQAIKTEGKQDGKEKKTKVFEPSVDFLDDALQDEWAAFQIHRKKIGHPLTLEAKRRIIEDLNTWRDIPTRIEGLRNAIESGWRKPFEPKEKKKPQLPYRTREARINKLNEKKRDLIRANAPHWKIHEIDMELRDL